MKHEDKIYNLCYDLVDFYASRKNGNLQLYMNQYLGVSSMDSSCD